MPKGKAIAGYEGVILTQGVTKFFGTAGDGRLMREAHIVLDGDDAVSIKIRRHLLTTGVSRTKTVWRFAVSAALKDARDRKFNEEDALFHAYKVGRASYALFHLIERGVIEP